MSGTCMDYPLNLDARYVQLFGKGMNSLEQIFTGFWVNVGPSGWDFNWKTKTKIYIIGGTTLSIINDWFTVIINEMGDKLQ